MLRADKRSSVLRYSVAWAETRLLLARIYSTYETQLDRIWLDKNGALLPEKSRKKLYPATVEEPIAFRKLETRG